METAKILKKSVLKPGKNWITLLNSAKIIKKNAVTPVNFHLYHYAGNNPVRYTDPDGREVKSTLVKYYMNDYRVMLGTEQPKRGPGTGFSILKISGYGCVLTDASRIANSVIGTSVFTPEDANKIGASKRIFLLDRSDDMGDVTVLDGYAFARLINVLLREKGIINKFVTFEEQFKGSLEDCLDKYENMEGEYYFSIRYAGGHTVSLEKSTIGDKNYYSKTDTSRTTYSSVDYDTIEYINVYKVNKKTGGDYYYE